jgi:hypothetical protein
MRKKIRCNAKPGFTGNKALGDLNQLFFSRQSSVKIRTTQLKRRTDLFHHHPSLTQTFLNSFA